MSLISGIINGIEDGVVKTGHFAGSAYKTIILSTGNRLTVFDLENIEGVEIGKEYTFPVEQKGQYINIVGAVTPVIQTESQDESPSDHALGIKPTGVVEQLPNKDEAIRRAVALKAAVEYATNMFETPVKPATPEEVIALAKVFEAYLA